MKPFFLFPFSFLNGNFIDEATEYSIREIHCKNSKNTKKQETPRNQKTKNSKKRNPQIQNHHTLSPNADSHKGICNSICASLRARLVNVRGEDSSLFSALPWKIHILFSMEKPYKESSYPCLQLLSPSDLPPCNFTNPCVRGKAELQ